MSPFLASLRRYLAAVDAGVAQLQPERRRAFMGLIERIATTDPKWASRKHEEWAPWLESWCRELSIRLADLQLDPAKLARCLDAGVAWQLDVEAVATTGSIALDLEVRRLSPRLDDLKAGMAELDDVGLNVEHYARELQLVRPGDTSLKVTRLGELARSLPEPDAVRWLLTIELVQTMGPEDPVRIWPAILHDLVQRPSRTLDVLAEREEPEAVAAAWERLAAMRLVRLKEQPPRLGGEGIWELHVHPPSIALFRDLLDTPNTPFGVLAVALLQDLTSSRLAEIGQPVAPSNTSIASRHSQLVSHEVRNRLGPARHAISDIRWRQKQGEPIEHQLKRIEHAVDRTLQFVAQQQKIAQLGGPGEEAIDPRAAIEAAVTNARNGVGAPIVLEIMAELPLIRGVHEDLVMILLNVLRNALEFISEEGRVLLQGTAEAGHLKISIEDDGPGIPPGIVGHIFEPGFSTRPGNRGMGLSLTHDFVVAWGGRIHHEPVQTGGARFILVLPGARKQ